MERMKVVRVTKEEYELDDGTIITHVSNLHSVHSFAYFC